MPQDAPADTAGPSSPPPRMPEGWLPQWEGVQRKWYYVQRTTGKSQWEIPTEPVVLTPSSTPTSIGTGPSQAPPSRPSTNSPRVTLARNTLAERIEAAADNARVSSSLDSQINGPVETPGWHSVHSSHQPQGYGQYTAPDQGLSRGEQISAGHPNAGPAAFYSNHAHPGQNQQFAQHQSRSPWEMGADGPGGTPNAYRGEHLQEPFGGLSLRPQASQQFHQYPSHDLRGYASSGSLPAGQLPGLGTQFPPSQPQWQSEQHGPYHNNAHQLPPAHFGTPDQLQPSSNAYSTMQINGTFPGDYGGQGYGVARGPSSSNSHLEGHSHPITGQPMSRTHSQQADLYQRGDSRSDTTGHSPFYGYTPQSSGLQNQYAGGAHIAPTAPGNGPNSAVLPVAPDPQSSTRFYQNPVVQANVHQHPSPHHYPNQHPTGHHVRSDVHSPAGTSSQTGHRSPWNNGGSRTAASDPQFVSGPWASSTPPSTGPSAPSHQG